MADSWVLSMGIGADECHWCERAGGSGAISTAASVFPGLLWTIILSTSGGIQQAIRLDPVYVGT